MAGFSGIVRVLYLLLSFYLVQGQFCDRSQNQCVPQALCKISRPILGSVQSEGCPPTEICCPQFLMTESKLPSNDVSLTCGQVNKDGLANTITNQKNLAKQGELPWMVALVDENNQYFGGGSLISPDVVLSGAYITENKTLDQIFVRAGEWSFKITTERYPHVQVGIRRIVRHPDFLRNTGANNVALLFLERPLELAPHIQTICMPPASRNFELSRCIVSGWGKEYARARRYMNVLKKIDVPVVRNPECQARMKLAHGDKFVLDESLICAGGELGKDSCFGDGGSPLVCPLKEDPERYEQAGIVNWGVGCGQKDTPGVYTSVAKLRGWIDQEIARNQMGNPPTDGGYNAKSPGSRSCFNYYKAS
uniref:Phenoloxidase-activating factor 2 n=1 Tax=Drosophila rhopaloa TaxID=1041015 RepID=A0A6P4FH82_DRORH